VEDRGLAAMTMRWWRRLAGGLLLLVLAVNAQARDHQDHIVERAVWEDTTAALGVEQAATADFVSVPNTSLLRRGYSESAFWIRLKITEPGPLVLRIQPPYLDDVRLYERTTHGWKERIAGDRHPYVLREKPDVAFAFDVQVNPSNQGVFWVRLQTTSSSIIDIQALTPWAAAQEVSAFDRFMGINMGLVAGVLIWALLQYVLVGRDPLVLKFIACEIVTLLIAMAIAGRLSDTLFPQAPLWADGVFNALVAAGTPVLAWFHRHFLTPYGLSRPSAIFLRFVVWVYPFQFVSILAGYPQWAMQANALLAVMCFFVFAFETWRIQHPDRLYWRMVRLAYGVLGLLLLPLAGSLFGLEIPVQPALYGVTHHGAFAAVLMLLLLNMRLRDMRLAAEQFRQDAALAVLQAEQERQHRQEQEQLLAMLAHEVKNPLAVIAMVVGSQDKTPRMLQQAGQAVQEVKTIIDQSLMLEHIGRDRAAEPQSLDVTAVLADITELLPTLTDRLRLPSMVTLSLVADPLFFKIVAQNLLANAVRYSPEQTPIDWVVRQEAGQWRIEVSNAVMPEAWPDAQRVFDKFYRAPAALRLSGTGLGLYVSRHLARRMGGDLLYQPTTDRVRFTWLIPV
jgi:signal transduction histidine kinase